MPANLTQNNHVCCHLFSAHIVYSDHCTCRNKPPLCWENWQGCTRTPTSQIECVYSFVKSISSKNPWLFSGIYAILLHTWICVYIKLNIIRIYSYTYVYIYIYIHMWWPKKNVSYKTHVFSHIFTVSRTFWPLDFRSFFWGAPYIHIFIHLHLYVVLAFGVVPLATYVLQVY